MMLRSRPVSSLHQKGQGGDETIIFFDETNRSRRKRTTGHRHARKGLSLVSWIAIVAFVSTCCYVSFQQLPFHRKIQHDAPFQANNLRKVAIATERSNTKEKEDMESQGKNKIPVPSRHRSLYDLEFPSIDGEMISFSRFTGQPAIVINVASE